MESKATTLLGIVAGGSSAIGIFGSSRDVKTVVTTPLVLGACAFVVVALLGLLYVLRAKRVDDSDLGSYVSAAMVDGDNRIGLALTLANNYRTMREQVLHEAQKESRALFMAYAATAAAAFLVLLNIETVMRDRMSITPHVLTTATRPVRSAATSSRIHHRKTQTP